MKKLLIVFLLIAAFGCTKKYTKSMEDIQKPADTAKEEGMKPGAGDEEMIKEMVNEEAIAGEGDTGEEALTKEQMGGAVFSDVFFDFDKYDIRPDARPSLDALASFLDKESGRNLIIEGHCDERGTNEYNLALGEKRAKSAKNYLAARGISSSRLTAVTFGEEKPLCTGQTEDCMQRNRRAHFVVTK